MSEARNEFIRATYALSKRDPQAWVEFRDAFNAYTIHEMERSLTIPLQEVQVALGMNRRMLEMRNDFFDIETLAQKIKVR